MAVGMLMILDSRHVSTGRYKCCCLPIHLLRLDVHWQHSRQHNGVARHLRMAWKVAPSSRERGKYDMV